MKRRQLLLSVATVVTGVAGCSSQESSQSTPASTSSPSENPTAAETETPSPTPTETPSPTPTEEIPSVGELSNTPNYDHEVVLRNTGTDSKTVDIQITQTDTGEVVYSESLAVDSDEKRSVFYFGPLEDRFGDVELFDISAETEESSDSIEFQTSECHGDPTVIVSDADVTVTYSVC